jgi:peptidase M28-like protein
MAMFSLRRATAVTALWLCCSLPAPAVGRVPETAARAIDHVSAADLRGYVSTLASDALNGRGVGDPGNRAAEEFICDTFHQRGVQSAAADGSCFQAVDVYRPDLDSSAHLRVVDESGRALADFATGASFYPLPETGAANVTAPLVFGGYGVTVKSAAYDDYTHVRAPGAIVLVLEGVPEKLARSSRLSEEDRMDLASPARKLHDAEAHGARGVVIVNSYLADFRAIWPEHPSEHESDYRLISDLRAHPAPLAAIAEPAAEPLRAALAAHRLLTATITPGLAVDPITIHNVLGLVEGRDPAHKGEMIVVGAHLDHEGTDAEGRIYHGADDNASGTAAVLAAATAFATAAQHGERPARTVLFALWNAEEKGSLGAEAFVESPQPARRIVANLNLDMIGRDEDIPDPNDWRFHGFAKTDPSTTTNTLHVLGYSYSPDLALSVQEANTAVGLTLLEDYDQGAQNLVQRSDDWPFLAHGIPALFLTTGLHPDYHTPQDVTERIDFAKLERVTRLAARTAWIVADGPAPKLVRSPAR